MNSATAGWRPTTLSDASRERWARLLVRELADLGYAGAASELQKEAGVQLRSDAMRKIQQFLQNQDWASALDMVLKKSEDGGVTMQTASAQNEAALILRKRQFIQAVLEGDSSTARRVFRDKLAPHHAISDDEVEDLATLLLCESEEDVDMMAKDVWREPDVMNFVETSADFNEVVPQGSLQSMMALGERDLSRVLSKKTIFAPKAHQSLSKAGRVVPQCSDVLLIHRSDVQEILFSPDGRLLASCSKDGAILIWKLRIAEANCGTRALRAKLIHQLPSLRDTPVQSVAWSPDSKYLLSCCEGSNIIQQWNSGTGHREHVLHHPTECIQVLRWVPNGKKFLSGSADNRLILWNAESGGIECQWTGHRVLDIAVHPCGTQAFVLVSAYNIYIVDLESESNELFFSSKKKIAKITLSPDDGRFLLVSFIKSKEIGVIPVGKHKVKTVCRGLASQRYILTPCFAGRQNELVLCGGEDARLYAWKVEDGELVVCQGGHTGTINSVQRHPCYPEIIATASEDETVRLWTLLPDTGRQSD